MESKMSIELQIKEKCRRTNVRLIPGTNRLLVCIFAGKETEAALKSDMEDVLSMDFCLSERGFRMIYQENLDPREIARILQESINSINELHFMTVSMMSDGMFSDPGFEFQIQTMARLVQGWRSKYGLSVTSEFTGIFECSRSRHYGYDYENAFKGIFSGLKCRAWDRVCHAEMDDMMESDFKRICKSIFLRMLWPGFPEHISQLSGAAADYPWVSLWLEEARLSEVLVCKELMSSIAGANVFGKTYVEHNANSENYYRRVVCDAVFRNGEESARHSFYDGVYFVPRRIDNGRLIPDCLFGFVRENLVTAKNKKELGELVIRALLAPEDWTDPDLQIRMEHNIELAIDRLSQTYRTKYALVQGDEEDYADEQTILGGYFECACILMTGEGLEAALSILKRDGSFVSELLRREQESYQAMVDELNRINMNLPINAQIPPTVAAMLALPDHAAFQDIGELLDRMDSGQLQSATREYWRISGNDVFRNLVSSAFNNLMGMQATGIATGASFTNWMCAFTNPEAPVFGKENVPLRNEKEIRPDAIEILCGKLWESTMDLREYRDFVQTD